MSRTRFVKGTITKTTGGNYNMYSDGDIVFNAGGKIYLNADKEHLYSLEPLDAPFPKTIAKCVVEYRPHKDWKGEFGMDWLRKSDSNLPVDNDYNGIVGKYGSLYATETDAVFTADNSLYKKHLGEYNAFSSYKGRYYVPNVTLMQGETAIFDTIAEVEETPDSLHYVYDTSLFELTILKKITVSKGKHTDKKSLKIKCLKTFSTKQSIRIIATKDKYLEKVGEFLVLPNDKIKNIEVLMIPVNYVKTIKIGSIKGNEKTVLKNVFKQAYIDTKIQEHDIPLKINSWWFDTFFTTKAKNGTVTMDTSGWVSLHSYLEDEFFDIKTNEIYKNHYRVYMLPDSLSLNGVAENIGNTKTVVVFQGRNDSSTTHELLHAMGLYHTFDNDGLFTYKLYHTDNIMDYTHLIHKQRFSTNRWQWKIVNPEIV